MDDLRMTFEVEKQVFEFTIKGINDLRDDQLYAKLMEFANAMYTMWDGMREEHEYQFKLVEKLKTFDLQHSAKETTDSHLNKTIMASIYACN